MKFQRKKSQFQQQNNRTSDYYGGIKFDDSSKKIVYQTWNVQNHMKPVLAIDFDNFIAWLVVVNAFRFLFIVCLFNRSQAIS